MASNPDAEREPALDALHSFHSVILALGLRFNFRPHFAD